MYKKNIVFCCNMLKEYYYVHTPIQRKQSIKLQK